MAAGQAPKAINFRRSSYKHAELVTSQALPLTAAQQPLTLVNIPAYGFLRGIWIQVQATGGVGTAVAFQPDAPFNALSITVQDTSGNPIFGPMPGTLEFAMLAQKYGAYKYEADGRQSVVYGPSASTTGSFTVWYYVPIEIVGRNGLGAITNLNAAAAYQLIMALSSSGTIYSTAPATTAPTITVSVFMDCWSQPAAHDVLGNMTTQAPPALNTTQFWTLAGFPLVSGYNKIQLTRLGYYIRTLLLIFANTSGARSDSVTPATIEVWKDNQPILLQASSLWRQRVQQDYGYPAAVTDSVTGAPCQDIGVYPVTFADDFGLQPGAELRNGYLPTLQSTKLEVRGTTGAAGTLYVLTNDVAPSANKGSSMFVGATL